MANIVLITVHLALFSSMATATSLKEMMGESLCDYKKTPEDCVMFGECLTEYGYTVNDPCDDEEVHAANIEPSTWPKIMLCDWKKSGQVKEDGTCDREKQMDAYNKIRFENPEIGTKLMAAAEKCSEDHKDNCIQAQFCSAMKFWKMCYPNAKLPKKNKPQD